MQVLQPRVLDLNEVVGGMIQMVSRVIGANIELAFLPGANLGRVKADPSQIEQVVLNLVVNARDAMPDGGRLTIETSNVTSIAITPSQHAVVEPGHLRDADRQRHRHAAWTPPRKRASSSHFSPRKSRAAAPGWASPPSTES